MQSYLLSLVKLVSMVMDDSLYSQLGVEECEKGENFEEVFSRNLKFLYSGKGKISNVIHSYIQNFIELFSDAVPFDPELTNPKYGTIFSLNFPKFSALFSIPLHIFMTGGLQFSDTSPVFFS